VIYTKNGKYDESKNSQAEKSFSAILVIGDARRLNFHLYKQSVKKIVRVAEEEGRHYFGGGPLRRPLRLAQSMMSKTR